MVTPEGKIKNYFTKQVSTLCPYVHGFWTGMFQGQGAAGTPDWVGVCVGQSIMIEFKRPKDGTGKGKIKGIQNYQHNRFTRAGSMVFLAESREDVDKIIIIMRGLIDTNHPRN